MGAPDVGGDQLLVDHQLLDRRGVEAPGSRPVRGEVARIGQPAAPLRLVVVDQLGHEGAHRLAGLGRFALGVGDGRQVEGQGAALAGRRGEGDPSPPRRRRVDQVAHGRGPLQEEVGVVLPRVADPAEHLHAVLGAPERRLGGQRRGHVGGQRPARRDALRRRLVEGARRVPHAGPGHLEGDEHVGAPVLDRLELPDRTTELHPLGGVGRRRRDAPVRHADGLGADQQRRQPADLGRRPPATGSGRSRRRRGEPRPGVGWRRSWAARGPRPRRGPRRPSRRRRAGATSRPRPR